MAQKTTKKVTKAKPKTTKAKPKTTKAKTAKGKTTKSTSKSKSKKAKDMPSDMGLVIVDDDLTIDHEKINEERRAYLEEARSQEAFD